MVYEKQSKKSVFISVESELARVSYLDSKSQNYKTKTCYLFSVSSQIISNISLWTANQNGYYAVSILSAFTEEAGIFPLIHSPQTEQSLVFRGAWKHISCSEI